MAKQSYTLYELNEYVRRVIALNFAEPIWINCEIAQVSQSRGHFYLELVEQDEYDEIKAKMSAAIWYRSFLFIKGKLGELTESLLSVGTHVQLKVKVDFNERYGLKLIVEDIDPSYTMGQLELQRQKIIERLKKADVIDNNKRLEMPQVIKNIAVISSETAAGYQDFVRQCEDNNYGYHFNITLFSAAMQGQNTEREVVAALHTINKSKDSYDTIAIIRGGGSKLDLSYFDNFNIAMAICQSNYPVITGIGHNIDLSVADMVSNLALKTPTAVADFIIDKSALYEARVSEMVQLIHKSVRNRLSQIHLRLNDISNTIKSIPTQRIKLEQSQLDFIFKQINFNTKSIVNTTSQSLKNAKSIIEANHPAKILSKGYVMVKLNGSYIHSKDQVGEQPFNLEFADGEIRAQKI